MNRSSETGKNLMAILLIGCAVLLADCRSPVRKVDPGTTRSIAVLPFTDADTTRANDYFSEGLSDEIAAGLSRIRNFKVIAHPSVFIYKGTKKTAREIAAEMHVENILEGKVSRTPDGFSIHVRLINGADEKEKWSAVFVRPVSDIFSLEQEITRTVAEKVEKVLSVEELTRLSRRPTISLEAYDQYLKGRNYYFLRFQASLRTAISYFENAVRLDTAFSKAWSGIADCEAALGYGSYELPDSAFRNAELAALTALKFDPTLAEPHTSLGYVKFYYGWDWPEAEREFREAIRLNPDYPLAYISYGYFLTSRQRFPEARSVFEKALELDPVSATVNTDMGFHLYYTGDYPGAEKELNYALTLNPKSPLAHLWLGRCFEEQSKYQLAADEFSSALTVNHEWPVALAALGYVYGKDGKSDSAKAVLRRLFLDSAQSFVTPYGIALVYAGLKKYEQTFYWLKKAYTGRSNWMVWLRLDPRWSGIRQDKRFGKLLEQVESFYLSQKPSPANPELQRR